MKRVVPLEKATEISLFGSKAVGLGQAMRDGLPVPAGVALSGSIVEAVAAGDAAAMQQIVNQAKRLSLPLAVRSSAVDEDGAAPASRGST
jgi:pyruvate,water dikinase